MIRADCINNRLEQILCNAYILFRVRSDKEVVADLDERGQSTMIGRACLLKRHFPDNDVA